MASKSTEYISEEKVQWLAEKLGKALDLLTLESRVGISIDDFNRKCTPQEVKADGEDEKATIAITFTGRNANNVGVNVQRMIRNSLLKDSYIPSHSDLLHGVIMFDLEKLSKLTENDFRKITDDIFVQKASSRFDMEQGLPSRERNV